MPVVRRELTEAGGHRRHLMLPDVAGAGACFASNPSAHPIAHPNRSTSGGQNRIVALPMGWKLAAAALAAFLAVSYAGRAQCSMRILPDRVAVLRVLHRLDARSCAVDNSLLSGSLSKKV